MLAADALFICDFAGNYCEAQAPFSRSIFHYDKTAVRRLWVVFIEELP
jgi:hypothetical protein